MAAVMAGQARPEVEAELHRWLERRGGVLREPLWSRTVDAIAGGARAVTLPGPLLPDDVPVREVAVR